MFSEHKDAAFSGRRSCAQCGCRAVCCVSGYHTNREAGWKGALKGEGDTPDLSEPRGNEVTSKGECIHFITTHVHNTKQGTPGL